MTRHTLSIAMLAAALLSGCGSGSGSADCLTASEQPLAGAVSLWTDSDVPSTIADADSSAMELGLKFSASQAGSVAGVRFYKAAANGGTHVGHLWDASGAPLGSVTFANETASGWQTATFSSPVAIKAGATYVVSYFAPQGHYAGVDGAFASGRRVGPLYAPSDAEAGGNGVFLRAASGGFPTSSYGANNYYVDLLFVPETVGTGLTGEYYDNEDLTNLKLTRLDCQVSFNWRRGSPSPLIGADTFSARWTGQVLAPVSGTYSFSTTSDDGVRLWIDGQQLINNWTRHSLTTNSGKITLAAGRRYDVRLEYFEHTGNASINLSWTAPGKATETIPTAQLFPASCTPSCSSKQCGSDGCGGSCGSCASGQSCDAGGQCVSSTPSCTPACSGKQCGSDGCGGSCGSCASGQSCDAGGQCVSPTPGCTPSCSGKQCGSDGCGGSCGSCASGQSCSASGQCVSSTPSCTPSCSGKQCGADGCGGSCGSCASGQSCSASGQCVSSTPSCTPACSGKQCGSDGCGGSCGSCASGQSCSASGQCQSASPAPSGSPPFKMMIELYGDSGSYAQQLMSWGLTTGATFHTPFTSSEQQFLQSTKAPFAYFAIPDEAGVASCYPSASDPNAGSLLTSLTQQIGPDVWRLAMPEFDQGGGCWATGRPSFGGMSDQQAYDSWMGFYLDTKQLRPYLSQSPQQRGHKWMAVCSFALSAQYAFDMGLDAVLVERNIDEMSGMTPGLAMIRGASRQHGGKPWGIDFSTWRYWNDGPTEYSNGRMVSGWSTSMFKRNMFIAYMGGANFIHNEAASYISGAASGSTLNALGLTVQQFDDFAVKRHPARGTPFVPVAFMQDHYSGLEPKFGEWMQGPQKWYWTKSYTAGDQFLSNLFGLAYPDYNLWGKLAPGAPKVLASDGSIDKPATWAAYRQALANGVDPRPWELMGNSRWGESFDVITNQSPLSALQSYRAVVLTTGAPMSSAQLSTLTQYVQQGGIVVLNAKQLPAGAESLTGLQLTGGRGSASSSTWLPDGTTSSEPQYNYALATPTTAAVLAQAAGSPIVTRNAVGSGFVYVTTPDFLSDSGNTRLLNVGQKLLDSLQSQFAPVKVTGPDVEYLVNLDGGKVIVTLVNNNASGATWSGTLSFNAPSGSYSVREWTADSSVGSTLQNGKVVVNATVPAWDVRVYALEAP